LVERIERKADPKQEEREATIWGAMSSFAKRGRC